MNWDYRLLLNGGCSFGGHLYLFPISIFILFQSQLQNMFAKSWSSFHLIIFRKPKNWSPKTILVVIHTLITPRNAPYPSAYQITRPSAEMANDLCHSTFTWPAGNCVLGVIANFPIYIQHWKRNLLVLISQNCRANGHFSWANSNWTPDAADSNSIWRRCARCAWSPRATVYRNFWPIQRTIWLHHRLILKLHCPIMMWSRCRYENRPMLNSCGICWCNGPIWRLIHSSISIYSKLSNIILVSWETGSTRAEEPLNWLALMAVIHDCIFFSERKLQPTEVPHQLYVQNYSTASSTCLIVRRWLFSIDRELSLPPGEQAAKFIFYQVCMVCRSAISLSIAWI